MTETGPVFLVIVRTAGVFEPAPHSFFEVAQDAWDYAKTFNVDVDSQVVRFDGLYAYTLRAMHTLALRELQKETEKEERKKNA